MEEKINLFCPQGVGWGDNFFFFHSAYVNYSIGVTQGSLRPSPILSLYVFQSDKRKEKEEKIYIVTPEPGIAMGTVDQ